MKADICEESRATVENKEGAYLAQIYFGENGFPNDNTESMKKSVTHIQQCDLCKKWLKKLIPADVFIRYHRMHSYCCTSMYFAVEEPKQLNTHIVLLWWRSELLWLLDRGKKTRPSGSFGFCPWCGNKLPNHPFINDQLGRGQLGKTVRR